MTLSKTPTGADENHVHAPESRQVFKTRRGTASPSTCCERREQSVLAHSMEPRMPKTTNKNHTGKNLDVLFHDTLKDIYYAEKKILSTLPKMAKAAKSSDLKDAFEKHRRQTEGHVDRLERVFATIDKKPQGKTCDAIVGITDEGAEIMKDYKGSPALD